MRVVREPIGDGEFLWHRDCKMHCNYWKESMSNQRTIGDIAVTSFIVVQLVDWIVTYQGLTLFGTSIEANPLLRFLMERYDIILVLTTVKISAAIAGSFLHFVNRHSVVAALTLLYTLFAIVPWMRMLAVYSF